MDIYDNIDVFDEVNSVTEIYNENKDLKMKVERYSAEMDKLRKDYNELCINHENLLRNYSSMFMTAKAEIARKTETIMMINKEKDQMFLRMISDRNNGKGRKNNKMKKSETEFTNNPLNSQDSGPCNPINKVLKENRFQACQFSSDEEDPVSKLLNRDNLEHKVSHTTRDSRDVRHKLRDRHTERVNERDRHRERGDRDRDHERERYNRDRHRLSPEHHQRGRAPHREFPENKYSRNKSRQRILRSPGRSYDRSKSRDRRHTVEYTNEKDDYHSLKHKIEDSNDDACPKRRRVESNYEAHRQVIKHTIEEVPSCQSPDDCNIVEENPNEPHVVKEIRATSTSHLDDPRHKHPKYVRDSDQQNEISLIAVSGQNVEIKQIPGYELEENKECKKIPDSDVITETTNVYCHSELSNMSVESGEIIDNIQHPDSSQTSNKLSYYQLPQSPSSDFDAKSYKISKRQSAKNVSSAQICHGPSPVELLYKEFESSLGHSSKSHKPSHTNTKSENLEENNDWKDLINEKDSSKPEQSITKNKTCDSLKKSIVEGDLELSDDNSDHVFEEVNKNKRHKTASSRKVTSKSHHKESKNENKCEDSVKVIDVCSNDDKVKHKAKSDHKDKDTHEKDSKQKKHDTEDKHKSTYKDAKIRHKSKDKSNKDKSNDSLINTDKHETTIIHDDNKKHDTEDKHKSSYKDAKIRHKSKDKSNKDKSKDILINKNKHKTTIIHDDKTNYQIKAVSEKELKNGHKSNYKGKEHVKDKKSQETKSKEEAEPIKSKSDTKSIPEKEANSRHEKKTRHKHKINHGDTANENALKLKDDPIDQSPTEDKIREIIAESCKKQSIVEKEISKTQNINIMEKMSDLFGDNSLITPEDLNIRSQTPCDIYSEFIPPGSPSDTQSPDDDLWNVATGAQTEDNQRSDEKLEIIKLRKVAKETKRHDNVSEVYKDINDSPVLSLDNPSNSDSSTKKIDQQGISSNINKIDDKESEKHRKKHHKSSKDVTDSNKNNFSEDHTEIRVENTITNNIAVDLNNITTTQTVYPENKIIRLGPEITLKEPDVVKTVIISTGVQQLSSLDGNDSSSALPMLYVNNSTDAIPNTALATSTPERESEIITSAVNSITNLSGHSSEENAPANHLTENGPEVVDKPDISIRIVRKGRRSLKKKVNL